MQDGLTGLSDPGQRAPQHRLNIDLQDLKAVDLIRDGQGVYDMFRSRMMMPSKAFLLDSRILS